MHVSRQSKHSSSGLADRATPHERDDYALTSRELAREGGISSQFKIFHLELGYITGIEIADICIYTICIYIYIICIDILYVYVYIYYVYIYILYVCIYIYIIYIHIMYVYIYVYIIWNPLLFGGCYKKRSSCKWNILVIHRGNHYNDLTTTSASYQFS